MGVNEPAPKDDVGTTGKDERRFHVGVPFVMLALLLIAVCVFLVIPAYVNYAGKGLTGAARSPIGQRDDGVNPRLSQDHPNNPVQFPPPVLGGRAPASISISGHLPETSGAAVGPQYVWNYWLTTALDSIVPDVKSAPIVLNTPQHLTLRLSDVDLTQYFRGLKSVPGSSLLKGTLAAGIVDPDRTTLDLEVLVQSADDTRLRIDTGSSRYKLSIDLAARRTARTAPIRPDTTPDADFLEAARLAEFRIDFTMLTPGSHEVGVVVLDALSGFPLQSMVVTVSDQSSAGAALKVVSNGQTLPTGAVSAADLALFLFDLASKDESAITRSLHAQLYYRLDDGSRDVVSWRADVDMAGLRSVTRSFVAATGSEKVGMDLTVIGEDFGALIFGPGETGELCDTGSNCARRALARSVLAAMADYTGLALPPTMVIRIVGGPDAGRPRATEVLPFGAMGIAKNDGDEPFFLGERFALALILSDHKIVESPSCPRAWRIAIPDREFDRQHDEALARAVEQLGPFLEHVAPEAVARQPASMEDLRHWFAGDATSQDKSFVFAFVGHHAENRLYLADGAGLNVGAVKRKFTRASIAILNACSSAIGDVNNGTLVGKLARNGVDSIIATTSAVSGDLAGAYIVCLDAVLNQPRSLTVGQAHALATQCLWSKERGETWPHKYNYHGAALKYLLIGDPNQLICPPMRKDVQ